MRSIFIFEPSKVNPSSKIIFKSKNEKVKIDHSAIDWKGQLLYLSCLNMTDSYKQFIGIIDFSSISDKSEDLTLGIFHNFDHYWISVSIAVFSKPSRETTEYSSDNSYVFCAVANRIMVRLISFEKNCIYNLTPSADHHTLEGVGSRNP